MRKAAALASLALCAACVAFSPASAHVSAQAGPSSRPGPHPGSAAAPQAVQAVRAYAALPEAVRSQLLLGEPRNSRQIAQSPFGTATTICNEGGPAQYVSRAAAAVSEAGYKWVGEYVHASWPKAEAAPLAQIASWSKLPARCREYLSRLQALDIQVLMRIDPVPTPMMRGTEPVTPRELALAAAYTRSVVAQLKPYVKHWQIGNEPNQGKAPQSYVRIAETVARSIRAEQPHAVVYGPAVAMLQCMANQPYPWLSEALEAGLLDHIDVFSFHPYRADGDRPEQASQFTRYPRWRSYEAQLDELRRMLRSHHAPAPALAVSEDGESTAVSADGQQRVTPVVNAKHELRRSLLDFGQGISPRIHFVFFRDIPDADFNHEGSFNTVDQNLTKRPLYYAAQNLHAVLDSSYEKASSPEVRLEALTQAEALPEPHVQLYTKHHRGFDELLVFFWAAVPAQSMHLRRPISLAVTGTEWEAPVLVDLMTMPGKARSHGHSPSTHRRVSFPVARKTASGVRVDTLELRDYPQLIKWVRVTAPQP